MRTSGGKTPVSIIPGRIELGAGRLVPYDIRRFVSILAMDYGRFSLSLYGPASCKILTRCTSKAVFLIVLAE